MKRRRGFTLTELLVVIGIIVLLIAILLPMLNKVRHEAARSSTKSDLMAIGQALDQYKEDFGDYPRPGYINTNGTKGAFVDGAATLCWALVAPGPATQDGAGLTSGTDTGANGFRLRGTQGKVYGPYLNMDHFRVGAWDPKTNQIVTPVLSPNVTAYDDAVDVLLDREGTPILYFATHPKASLTDATHAGLVASDSDSPPVTYPGDPADQTTALRHPYLQYSDIPTFIRTGGAFGGTALTEKMVQYRLGDRNFNGVADAGEVPVVGAPYLLWSAGPDGQFGPTLNTSKVTTGDDDDVTYPLDLDVVPPGMAP